MLDIIVVLVLLFAAFEGYKKGMLTMLISFVGTIIALIIAYMFGGAFKLLLIRKFSIDEVIFNKVADGLKQFGERLGDTNNFQNNGFEIAHSPLPDPINTSVDNYLADKTTAVMNASAQTISDVMVNILSYALLFFIAVIVIKILAKVLNTVFQFPVLKQFNKLGGVVFSVLGILLIMNVVFLLLVSSLSIDKLGALNNLLKTSYVCRFLLVEYNPILMLLSIK